MSSFCLFIFVQFFIPNTLSQLANLYQYKKDTEENNSKEQTSDPAIRQKVHDLLLKVCKSFKFGICFSIMVGALLHVSCTCKVRGSYGLNVSQFTHN